MSRILVTVITGFLGSGKTTLLNRLLKHPDMAQAAVIVNEFGEIGIDYDLIETSNETVIQLENGCLCCTVKGFRKLVWRRLGVFRRCYFWLAGRGRAGLENELRADAYGYDVAVLTKSH